MSLLKIRDEAPRDGRCRGCGAWILWVTTVNGKFTCLDRLVKIVTLGDVVLIDAKDTHWATCPKRALFGPGKKVTA